MLKKIIFSSFFFIAFVICNNSVAGIKTDTRNNPAPFLLSAPGAVDNTVEYNALQDFYNATGGTNWTEQTNWLTSDVSTWFGVTVEEDDVVELILNKNNLIGQIPTNIGDLHALKKLFLSKNQLSGAVPQVLATLPSCLHLKLNDNMITALPDYSSHPEINDLKLQLDNNNLDFGDLEPFFHNDGNSIVGFISYKDQAEIGVEQELTFYDGMPINMSIETPGSYNTYQWQKMELKNVDKGNNNAQSSKIEWVDIEGATDSVYTVIDYIKEDVLGTYRCAVSNTKVPGLTLYTKEISINIEDYTETRFYVNTTDLKNGLDYQATMYQIIAPELDDTLAFGSRDGFVIVNPDSTANIILNVLNNSADIGVGYLFKVDRNGTIHDLKLVTGMDQAEIHPFFFETQGSELSLFPVIPLKKKWSRINLSLENGVYFTPDNDGFYDRLEVKRTENITQFLLEVRDVNNTLIYDTNDLSSAWDGIVDTTTNALVSPGIYQYFILADDTEVSGQFIIKY